jgi:hypothetical protein
MYCYYSGEGWFRMGRFSDWLGEIEEILDITLFNKWLWIIVAGAAAVVIFPFFIISAIMMSPPWLGAVITILIIIGWGVAGGYKEWSLHKRKQEKAKFMVQNTVPFTYERHSEKDNDYD